MKESYERKAKNARRHWRAARIMGPSFVVLGFVNIVAVMVVSLFGGVGLFQGFVIAGAAAAQIAIGYYFWLVQAPFWADMAATWDQFAAEEM